MSETQQKKADYIYGMKPHESVTRGHEMRTAQNSCQFMLPLLREKAEKNPRLKLLDVGCGPGSITVSLAQLMPQGQVTALDLSEAVLEKAKGRAKQMNATNLDFVVGNVYELPFEDGTFDIVHIQQTICHTTEPVKAIRELVRVTKKGGAVCIRDSDLHTMTWWPASQGLTEWFDVLIKVCGVTGANAKSARQLKALTAQAGVPRENLICSVNGWCYSTPEERLGWGGSWSERCVEGSFAEKAVEMGFCSR